MFQLNKQEADFLLRSQIVTLRSKNEDLGHISRSQFATLKKGHGKHSKYLPLAFTEQGIAMLSSVLNSDIAIQVNIQIIRIFIKLHEIADTYKEFREKIEEMKEYNEANFLEVFRVLGILIAEDKKPKKQIGFETKL